jgi:hypothetical protein
LLLHILPFLYNLPTTNRSQYSRLNIKEIPYKQLHARQNATMVQERTTGNPLCAGSIALFMATSLPKGEGPQLKNATEAVALAIHAGMIAVGFRLIGLGEDERIGETANTPSPCVAVTQVLKYS